MSGGMLAVWIALISGNVQENMSLNRLNGGTVTQGGAANGRALAIDVGRFSVLPASVHCNSVDGVEAKKMTKQELTELLFDIHDYCYFVSGICSECAINPCKLNFEKDGFAVFPYEWDIERLERESNALDK